MDKNHIYEDERPFFTNDGGQIQQMQQTQEEEKRRKRSGRRKFFGGFLTGVLVAAVVAGLLTRGLAGRGISGVSSGSDSVLNQQSVSKLQLLEAYINQYFYQPDELTTEQMQNGLYKGLFESLNDPYSVYYTEEEFNALMEQTTGTYCGIGAYISTDASTQMPVIAGVIEGSPAEEAELQAGDIIYKVEGEDVTGLALDAVVSRIKGEEGTQVHITFVRNGEEVEKDFTRASINSPTVSTKMLDENIGYLRITEFDDVTIDQFNEKFASLKTEGMKAMILDLRSNPGGNVSTVTAIAKQLLPEGLIFYMEDKSGERTEYTCEGADFDLPLVVLVNEYSASASEILSGAVQDAGIGKIVGVQTYGKGVVQNVMKLNDGTAIKITVANYYTRGGQNINKVGITPDVVVEMDSEAYLEDGTDTQLNKAIELLGGSTEASEE